MADRIKTVTLDLSELESRRLASCQEAETLEQQLQNLPESVPASDEEALERARTSVAEGRYQRLFLLREILYRISEDEQEEDSHALAALAALEERYGWNAANLCKDVIDCLGDDAL